MTEDKNFDSIYNVPGKHLDTIKGEPVYLNGKHYLRVKFRIVDILDYNSANHLESLETEIEMLKYEIESLTIKETNHKDKIFSLQTLVKNLFNSDKSYELMIQKDIDLLLDEKKGLVEKINNLEKKIFQRDSIIKGLNKKIRNQAIEIKNDEDMIERLELLISKSQKIDLVAERLKFSKIVNDLHDEIIKLKGELNPNS